MVDVISGGRPERPRPRWQRPVLAIVVALILAASLDRLAQGGHHVVGTLPVPASTTISAQPSARPPAPPPAAPLTAPLRAGLAGLAGTLPAGLELVVGGQHPLVLGAPTPWLDRLPVRPDQAMTGAFPVAGGIIAQVQRLEFSSIEPSSRIYFVRRDGSYVLLTSADKAVPSANGEDVFALSLARGPATSGTLLEVSLTGRQVARHRVPVGFTVWSDSSAGLLVSSYPATGVGSSDLRIVDPATLVTRRDLGRVNLVEAATGSQVASLPVGCSALCDLTVADTAHLGSRTVSTPAGFTVGVVEFSPGDRLVAISYLGEASERSPGFLEVVDLATGSRIRIPGVATALDQTADLAWTPDGRSLAVGVAVSGDVRRVALWSSGDDTLRLLPGEFADTEDSASTLLAL